MIHFFENDEILQNVILIVWWKKREYKNKLKANKAIQLLVRFSLDHISKLVDISIKNLSINKMKFVVFLIISIFVFVESNNIWCEFMNPDYYQCEVCNEVVTSEPNRIEQVFGEHAEKKSNADIKYFHTRSKYIEKLPENLHDVFPNLENIEIESPTFREITKNDLKAFGKNLKVFSLSYTGVDYIPPNLFKATPNLTHLEIESTEIKFLSTEIFKDIPKLEFLRVNLTCYDGQAFNEKDLIEMIWTLSKECSEEEMNVENEVHLYNYRNHGNYKEFEKYSYLRFN